MSSNDGELGTFVIVFPHDQGVREIGGMGLALRPGDELAMITAIEAGSVS